MWVTCASGLHPSTHPPTLQLPTHLSTHPSIHSLAFPTQGRQSMVGGVGTATEDEEDVNPAEARTWIDNPDLLLNLQNSAILEKLRR